MTVLNLIDRQYSTHPLADLGIANIGAGNSQTITLPPNALLLSMFAVVTTAFNSATTDTLSVSDGTTTFVAAVDATTIGSKTVTNAPKFYPSGGVLTVSLAETGATATAGRALVSVSYLVVGRGHEIQA